MPGKTTTINKLDNNPWGKPDKKPQAESHERPDNIRQIKPGQDSFEKAFKNFKKKFTNGSGSGGGKNNNVNVGFVGLVVLLLIFLWGLTGIYVVQTDEEGLVLRFGKFSRIATPGLNYHLPFPVESVHKVKVTAINKLEVGYRSKTSGNNKVSNRTEESLMLTGDENIVDIHFEVQWKIKDAYDYLFNIRDDWTGATVKNAAESAMREVIGKTQIALALAEGKFDIEAETKELLQSILNSYHSGIEVVRLQMLKVDPPAQVIDAFRDVQTAKADKEREINQAEAYKRDILPKARGKAAKITENAEAYKQSVIAEAQGRAARFSNVYREYRNAKFVTRKRMYLDTMQSIYSKSDVIIVDDKASKSGVVPYLPLEEVKKKK